MPSLLSGIPVIERSWWITGLRGDSVDPASGLDVAGGLGLWLDIC